MPLPRHVLAVLMSAILLFTGAVAAAETPADYDMSAPQALTQENLYAQSALLVDEASGEILFSKNSRVRMYPASTTKIMTLLLGLENGPGLDEQVTIPKEAADIAEGSSVIPVLPGDIVRYEDLLYGFMLSSGNDGANAVAVLTDGSIEAFVGRMNARAAALGMEGTHYANAHGYHDAEHYTTAQDLAILSRAAMENDEFRKIVGTAKWTVSVQRGGEPVNIEIVSRNSLLQSDMKYYYPDCTGIKTGHHNKAGWCFVGSAERDGKRVICVVLNCAQENDKWYDAARLFEYGFTQYEDATLGALLEKAWERFERVQIEGADVSDAEGGSLLVNLGPIRNGDAKVPVVRGSAAAFDSAVERVAQSVSIQWQSSLQAPVSEGEALGSVSCALPDGATATAALTSSRAIQAQPSVAPPPRTEAPKADSGEGSAAARRDPPDNRRALLAIAGLLLLLACSVAALLMLRNARAKRRRRRRRWHR